MKKIIAVLSLILLTGCAGGMSVGAGQGAIFTMAEEGVMAINGQEISRSGKACGFNILGLVSWGESTVEEAKRDGNITNVATIDRDYFGVLGIFAKSCLIIKGN